MIIYGHSMGTGITPHAVVEAHAEGLGRVDGIILDSPFHSFKYAMQSTFLGRLFDTTQFLKDIAVEFDNPRVLFRLYILLLLLSANNNIVITVARTAGYSSQNIPRYCRPCHAYTGI